MKFSKIEWTDRTWNPITGCSKYSEGCKNCYAETMSKRLNSMKIEKYKNGFELTLHEESLDEPYSWKKPCNVFVCSMSDLFHENVPFEYIERVMDTITSCKNHRFQILTKRADRMALFFSKRRVPSNAWLGVTVENKMAKCRIDFLRNIEAKVHFLSCEPLLEDIGLIDLENIQWVIVGGESGPNARPMKKEWVYSIESQLIKQGVPFFFKQWGTYGPDGVRRSKIMNGKLLDGRIIQQMPYI